MHQRDEQLGKNFCLEKGQANTKARGVAVTTRMGKKEFVKPWKLGWNYGKFSNVRIDLYSNSLML